MTAPKWNTNDPGPAAHPAKNVTAGPGLPNPSDEYMRRNTMVGTHAYPEPAPVTTDGVLIVAEDLANDFGHQLLEPRDYHAAQEAYERSAERHGRQAAHPVALNDAVGAVAPVIAAAALERLYRRLMVLADQVNHGRIDAFEVGLRIAAVHARGLGRELAGGEQR